MQRQAEVEKERAGSTPALSFDVAAFTAARLLSRGVNVIPLKPRDKRPATPWEAFQDKTLIEGDADLDRFIASWWWIGADRGVGAVTGAVSSIVAADVDDDDGRELVERTCGWPTTVTVKTARGWHLWFRHPGGRRPNRARIGGVGLDVRGDGGFAIAPPSVHPSGFTYSWERSPWEHEDGMWPPAPMPPALVDLIWPARVSEARPKLLRSPAGGDRYVRAALEQEVAAVSSAPEGARNDQLNRSAFAIARFVKNGQLPAVAVADAFVNAARRAGLPEREAERTVESALRGALA